MGFEVAKAVESDSELCQEMKGMAVTCCPDQLNAEPPDEISEKPSDEGTANAASGATPEPEGEEPAPAPAPEEPAGAELADPTPSSAFSASHLSGGLVLFVSAAAH